MSYRKSLYTHTKHNLTNTESIEHIKWCRRNLGERGTDWDFAGNIYKDKTCRYI